jgi:hypothetical protein
VHGFRDPKSQDAERTAEASALFQVSRERTLVITGTFSERNQMRKISEQPRQNAISVGGHSSVHEVSGTREVRTAGPVDARNERRAISELRHGARSGSVNGIRCERVLE